jgi:hypothetical protein
LSLADDAPVPIVQWEILGDLALRLQHKEEAKDAYQRCLDSKFSAKSWQKLLETYADEGDLQKTLNAATRLTTYNWRWYTESCYPTAVGTSCCPRPPSAALLTGADTAFSLPVQLMSFSRSARSTVTRRLLTRSCRW